MIYLSIGSNVGDRQGFLEAALKELDTLARVIAWSSVYETAPWGNTNQASFLNVSAAIDSSLQPLELLKAVKKIEQKLGRKPREHWGPREIDIDIIFWHENESFSDESLTIPHLEYANRAFVVVPTLEVVQKVKDLAIEKSLEPLVKNLQTDDVVKLTTKLSVKLTS